MSILKASIWDKWQRNCFLLKARISKKPTWVPWVVGHEGTIRIRLIPTSERRKQRRKILNEPERNEKTLDSIFRNLKASHPCNYKKPRKGKLFSQALGHEGVTLTMWEKAWSEITALCITCYEILCCQPACEMISRCIQRMEKQQSADMKEKPWTVAETAQRSAQTEKK